MPLRKTVAETTRLIEVAQGLAPADMYVANGQVLNVYSGEILTTNVAVAGERVAYVGASDKIVGPSTQIIDAAGYYVLPGFLEPHAHPWCAYNPTTVSMEMLTRGTTGLFAAYTTLQPNMSLPDFHAAVDELLSHPCRVFVGIAGETGFNVGGVELDEETVARELFALDGIFGLSELYAWPQLLGRDQEILDRLAFARRHGKTLEAHIVGANADRLNGIAAGGYTSCHEATSAAHALDRLRLGLHAMLRHNSWRPDLPEWVKLLTEHKVSTSRLMWTTDGIQAPWLREHGHLDYVITRAVEMGVDPITAIQMSTINVATYFGLDGEIGGIAPGRLADLLLVKDLRSFTPYLVISGGRVVVRERKLAIDYPQPAYYARVRNRYKDPSSRIREFRPEMFLVPSESDMEFPVVRMSGPVLTKRQDALLRARDGYLTCDPDKQIMHCSAVDVVGGGIGSGFVAGLGFCPQGIASTIVLGADLVALGARPEEMARAANRVLELGGGIVIAQDGRTLLEMPLPLASFMSLAPLSEVADHLAACNAYMHDHGFPFDDPFVCITWLSGDGLPDIRLTLRGVVETRTGAVLFPAASAGA